MLVFSSLSINATTNKYSIDNSMSQNLNDCPIHITVHEAWDMLTNTSTIQIPIDVRSEAEWNSGFISTPWPECPIWYAKSLLETQQGLEDFLEFFGGNEIMLYSKDGNESLIGTYILCNASFNGTIYNMLGGITEWNIAGYPIRDNSPPDAPIIDGPRKGSAGINLVFELSTEDAEEDPFYYWIDWDDRTPNEWIGPFRIDETITLFHSWEEEGTYLITAKVKDYYDNESDMTEIEINIPRTRASPHLLWYEWLLERFPLLERLLGLIMN